jgi:electron transfer flavoprotein alpha subunit
MSVLVFVEQTGGKVKKSSLEALTFGDELAGKLGVDCIGAAAGSLTVEQLQEAGNYGATRIFHFQSEKLKTFTVQAYAGAITWLAQEQKAHVIVMAATYAGKNMAPRIAVRLNAALGDSIIAMPDISQGFQVRKGAFSGKAFVEMLLLSEKKVLTLGPNSFEMKRTERQTDVVAVNYEPQEAELKLQVKQIVQATDKVALPEAELVVSGGRGLKGPENWKMIEELAEVLGAATACSKPVSDAGWRPHSEHVGQTGIAISPNLYIAVGISGAIQHLAGVSSSKTIVVINKDPEAPFFKAADYGIVGDAFDVVPRLTEAIRKFKAQQ